MTTFDAFLLTAYAAAAALFAFGTVIYVRSRPRDERDGELPAEESRHVRASLIAAGGILVLGLLVGTVALY